MVGRDGIEPSTNGLKGYRSKSAAQRLALLICTERERALRGTSRNLYGDCDLGKTAVLAGGVTTRFKIADRV
jgi:hypothetical protein